MPERINTTNATAISAIFNPVSDFSVQAEFQQGSKAYIDVEAQVDGAAPWVPLGSLSAASIPPIARFAKCVNVRLRLYNNDGQFVKAWSGE